MNKSGYNEALRDLPAVHTLLNSQQGKDIVAEFGNSLFVEAANFVLEGLRLSLLKGEPLEKNKLTIFSDIKRYLGALTAPRLKKVVNATGIILHTNLGRALMSQGAREAILTSASCNTNLEYNLEKGERGSRYDLVEDLLIRLTGAESGLVVNNNAAAVLLVMNTLARDREVVVSRGELVEIGGSFRIPEVLKSGGARLREVGTTNRTHLSDYKNALTQETALILKVHTSNFKVIGFTKSVRRKELAQLAHDAHIPLVEDLGSGSLLDLSSYGLMDEPPVPRVVAQGVDVVTFSGDKLLGGPQAGIIVGKQEYIKRMKENHLTRALRVDKFTLAALESTLREYLNPEQVFEKIPFYRMLTADPQELKEKAQDIVSRVTLCEEQLEIVETKSFTGAGSQPGQSFPSWGIALNIKGRSLNEAEYGLRKLPVPIIAYIDRERLIFDMRTLLPGDEEIVARGIKDLVCQGGII